MRQVVVLIAVILVAVWAGGQVRRLVRLATVAPARRRLDSLRELVTAWQLANGDEVAVLDRRVADAQTSMVAAEEAAQSSARHLARIERHWRRRLDVPEQRRAVDREVPPPT